MLREAVFAAHALLGKQSDINALPAAHMEESAFQEFYMEVAPPLRRYIRKTSGNASLSEDIFQEAFYRFLRANLPPMDRPHMKAYLYKIATSLLMDHWRREKRERFWKNLWPPAESPQHEQRSDVSRAFYELKPQERALLWLAYVEGLNHSEIASTLRFNEKSIRVLLFRARKKLARTLERQRENSGELL